MSGAGPCKGSHANSHEKPGHGYGSIRETGAPERRDLEGLEFQPAALEVQETPPSPLGRWIAWSLMIMFTLAIVWAVSGEVDIVAVAHGKIIPAGKSKVIQPLEAGMVRAIHVSEGEHVRRGQLLIDLDTTGQDADLQRLRAEMAEARASLARVLGLKKVLATGDPDAEPAAVFGTLNGSSVERIQNALMHTQLREFRSRDRSLAIETEKRRSEQAAVEAELAKTEAIVPLITQRVEALKTLMSEKLVARNDYLELEQQRIEAVQDLAVLRHRKRVTADAIRKTGAERQLLLAEFQASLEREHIELESRLAALNPELAKAESRVAVRHLKAPVDGVVQQLSVNTIEGVVTPAQALMVIVPEAYALEVEALILNRDIGFVREGQQAEIKVDAFPFTKYGTIDGAIEAISDDAVETETLGWAFTSRVSMSQSFIDMGGRSKDLTPGMSVSVEIKTGKRRIIEYILSPLIRYAGESVRER